MDEAAGRPDVMEKLAFFQECRFRRGEIAIFEQTVGTDEIAQPDLYVCIGPPDMVDAESPARIGMPQGKYPR